MQKCPSLLFGSLQDRDKYCSQFVGLASQRC
jgi:hypothetical protein